MLSIFQENVQNSPPAKQLSCFVHSHESCALQNVLCEPLTLCARLSAQIALCKLPCASCSAQVAVSKPPERFGPRHGQQLQVCISLRRPNLAHRPKVKALKNTGRVAESQETTAKQCGKGVGYSTATNLCCCCCCCCCQHPHAAARAPSAAPTLAKCRFPPTNVFATHWSDMENAVPPNVDPL